MSFSPCTRCASPVHENAIGCPHCGAPPVESEEVRSAAMVLLGLSMAGCQIFIPQPKYGGGETGYWEDYDGDGYTVDDGDCDDDDPDIHPDAEETAGDGIDSNCDGEDDT